MFRKTIHILAVFAVLFVSWCVFSGIFTPFFLFLAIVCCLMATLVTKRMEIIDQESHPFQLIYLGPLYWSWLAKEMLFSGLKVTRMVWKLEPELNPGFAWVKTNLSSDLGRAVYANSLTLTPGTVCVELEARRAYIHALDRHDLDRLELGETERRVERITAFAIKGGGKGTA